MMRQFTVEVRRFAHRRGLKVLLGLALVVVVVTGLATFFSSGPRQEFRPIGGDFSEMRSVTVDQSYCPSSLVTLERFNSGNEWDYLSTCPDRTPTSIPHSIDVYDDVPNPYAPWNGGIALFSLGAAVALWMLAASFVGGEFRHGTVETALVAEPRRGRLLTVRLAAVVSVCLLTFGVMIAGFLTAIAPSALLHGTDGASVPPQLVAAAVGRGALLVILLSVFGAALAVVGRGALLALAALPVLGVITAVLFLFVRPIIPLDLPTNIYAVVTGGDGLRAFRVNFEIYESWQYGAGWPWIGAVAVVVLWCLAAVGAAYGLFLKRDVK